MQIFFSVVNSNWDKPVRSLSTSWSETVWGPAGNCPGWCWGWRPADLGWKGGPTSRSEPPATPPVTSSPSGYLVPTNTDLGWDIDEGVELLTEARHLRYSQEFLPLFLFAVFSVETETPPLSSLLSLLSKQGKQISQKSKKFFKIDLPSQTDTPAPWGWTAGSDGFWTKQWLASRRLVGNKTGPLLVTDVADVSSLKT